MGPESIHHKKHAKWQNPSTSWPSISSLIESYGTRNMDLNEVLHFYDEECDDRGILVQAVYDGAVSFEEAEREIC